MHKETKEVGAYLKVLKNLENLGEKYCKENLNSFDIKKLSTNWWEALKFFFNHTFMRGRNDELSGKYLNHTLSVLEDLFEITSKDLEKSYSILMLNSKFYDKTQVIDFKGQMNVRNCLDINIRDKFNDSIARGNKTVSLLVSVANSIKDPKQQIPLGNDLDLVMVLDVLDFISNENRKNIYKYLKDTIQEDGLSSAYRQLVNLSGIGDKLASFTLRDICLLNPSLKIDDYELVFPIDTWARQVSEKIFKYENDTEIKGFFIKQCAKDFNFLKVSAGIWYIGANSLELLISLYKKQDFKNI